MRGRASSDHHCYSSQLQQQQEDSRVRLTARCAHRGRRPVSTRRRRDSRGPQGHLWQEALDGMVDLPDMEV